MNLPLLPVGAAIVVLAFFLDLLEMSFARILRFLRTLRYWLYFILHCGISFLAAYLLRSQIQDWYLLAPAATFLGVAVISNTDVKVAGFSIVPIAELFVSIKTKMIEQAGEDKATELRKAHLIEELQKLGSQKLERACSAALMACDQNAARVEAKLAKARAAGAGNQAYFKNILIGTLLKASLEFAEQNIEKWKEET